MIIANLKANARAHESASDDEIALKAVCISYSHTDGLVSRWSGLMLCHFLLIGRPLKRLASMISAYLWESHLETQSSNIIGSGINKYLILDFKSQVKK